MRRFRKLANTVYDRSTERLPSRLAAFADTITSPFRSWGGPLNGQAERQRLVQLLLDVAEIEQVVETGTFRGATTAYFAERLVPVFTVDAQPRYFEYSRRFLAAYPNVTIELGDSRRFLHHLARIEDVRERRTLFYLDAHWERDLPLAEELRIIAAAWSSALIVIDDFEVPHDPGYGYDDYGGDRRLDADYLPAMPGWSIAYPTAPSSQETGAKRGWVVLASPTARDVISQVHGLQPA